MGTVTELDAPSPEPGTGGLCGVLVAEGAAAVAAHLRGWPMAQGGFGLDQAGPPALDIVFGREGNAAILPGAGWSAPEPGFTWTVGPRATLVLPRPLEAARWTLELQLSPFVHPPRLPFQRLALEVNGVAAPPLAVSDDAVVAVDFSWAVLAGRPSVELVFSLPDAARPAAVAGRADDRALAFCLRRLMLAPTRAAAKSRQAGSGEADGPAPLTARDWRATGAGALAADDLLMRFESLGENCEFGLVQRRCGVEPLGLLRFASAPLPNLLAALRAGFAGMGSPENVVVELSANGGEYMVQDRAFAITYHAWVRVGEQTPAAIHAREVRRIPFLVRKMLEDLQAGEKIFVYHGMAPLDLPAALALAAAVRAHGPGVVLWVEQADAAHPAGSAEWVSDGLLKGHVARFAPGEDAQDLDWESWMALCRTVSNKQKL